MVLINRNKCQCYDKWCTAETTIIYSRAYASHTLGPPASLQSVLQQKSVPPAHLFSEHIMGVFFGHLARPPWSLQQLQPIAVPSQGVPSPHSKMLSLSLGISHPHAGISLQILVAL